MFPYAYYFFFSFQGFVSISLFYYYVLKCVILLFFLLFILQMVFNFFPKMINSIMHVYSKLLSIVTVQISRYVISSVLFMSLLLFIRNKSIINLFSSRTFRSIYSRLFECGRCSIFQLPLEC